MAITAKAATSYAGYRVSFGHAHPILGKFFAYGYKSHFSPTVGSVGSVSVPFKNFTDFWDDATGEPIHTVRGSPLPGALHTQRRLRQHHQLDKIQTVEVDSPRV